MITHLGLPEWQYAFTPYGPSPQAKVAHAGSKQGYALWKNVSQMDLFVLLVCSYDCVSFTWFPLHQYCYNLSIIGLLMKTQWIVLEFITNSQNMIS